MWRKESVTILEKAEDVEEEDEATMTVDTAKFKVELQQPPESSKQCRRLSATGSRVVTSMASKVMRRASSGGDPSSASMDDNFLTVPQTVTASSSAETLTGNNSLANIPRD